MDRRVTRSARAVAALVLLVLASGCASHNAEMYEAYMAREQRKAQVMTALVNATLQAQAAQKPAFQYEDPSDGTKIIIPAQGESSLTMLMLMMAMERDEAIPTPVAHPAWSTINRVLGAAVPLAGSIGALYGGAELLRAGGGGTTNITAGGDAVYGGRDVHSSWTDVNTSYVDSFNPDNSVDNSLANSNNPSYIYNYPAPAETEGE